jgi:hypothetical protein
MIQFLAPTHIWCSELELYNTNTSKHTFYAAFPILVYLTNPALISCYMQGSTTVNFKMSSKFICLATVLSPVHLQCVYFVIIVILFTRTLHLANDISNDPGWPHKHNECTHTHIHTHTQRIRKYSSMKLSIECKNYRISNYVIIRLYPCKY